MAARGGNKRADRRAVPLLSPGASLWFPPALTARRSGLLAAGGDLSPERLIYAYSKGIFPWYDEGTPILWWSPDPRCVLFPEELHIPRSLAKELKSGRYAVSFNSCFEQVIRHCAAVPRPGQRGTWLLPEMMEAYTELHRHGVAFSVEVWEEAGDAGAGKDAEHAGSTCRKGLAEESVLVGGMYGLALGKACFGESMFHLRPNASKVALVALVEIMLHRGMAFLDCQQTTSHMVSLGAREISRREFLTRLAGAVTEQPMPGSAQ